MFENELRKRFAESKLPQNRSCRCCIRLEFFFPASTFPWDGVLAGKLLLNCWICFDDADDHAGDDDVEDNDDNADDDGNIDEQHGDDQDNVRGRL